ncbi:NAD(P)-dependent oxidoreductase [Geobacter sp. DSM 9736]|uniref:NAD-dependent epimerase/dehydratase family protein n=1 Tax=Geobacter sp. DSM 9736 TaxID=1277350 RepID=UPI000B509494|nr:NAD(P)-dependent oxidoreductase [Geobacter sp. DSM 9736]SNB47005.1 UDP-glucose 4-epimerase [Geobacter sp. DSM 9736]
MKKAVVFGGAGFLGSHVADALTDAGYGVTVFDIRPSPWLRENQKMIVGDILDAEKVAEAVSGCEVVYNFAGIADIDEARRRRLDSIKCNVLGNASILEACHQASVSRYIFASSLYVYSKSGSFYRSTKQACELFIENYHDLFGIPYTILRYGSLYGPRADNGNFIESILKQAIEEGVIVREGNGEEIREYIHIFDAARFSVDILAPEFANEHVIITGNQQMKIKDLLQMIQELMDNRVKVKYVSPKHTYHYQITPYTFAPKIARRLVSKSYLDLGQGILSSIERIYEELNPPSPSYRIAENLR